MKVTFIRDCDEVECGLSGYKAGDTPDLPLGQALAVVGTGTAELADPFVLADNHPELAPSEPEPKPKAGKK